MLGVLYYMEAVSGKTSLIQQKIRIYVEGAKVVTKSFASLVRQAGSVVFTAI